MKAPATPPSGSALREELRLLFVTLQFLTRVPIPAWVARDGWQPDWLNRCVRHFPLVGAAIGAVGAAVALLGLALWPPVVAAVLAVAATVWLTAAFHEDGLADTADALLGAAPREKALAIMKDSRIGTYGAAALGLALLLRVLLLAELLRVSPSLAAAVWVTAHAAGRAAAVALMAMLPYGGDEAHAKAKPLARDVRRARPSAMTGCCSNVTCSGHGTWRCRSSPIDMAARSTCTRAIAPSSAATRRCSRKRRRLILRLPCASACMQPRSRPRAPWAT